MAKSLEKKIGVALDEKAIEDKLRADLAALNEKKATACGEEIQAVLKKHGMGFVRKISLVNGNQIQVELSIVPVP